MPVAGSRRADVILRGRRTANERNRGKPQSSSTAIEKEPSPVRARSYTAELPGKPMIGKIGQHQYLILRHEAISVVINGAVFTDPC